MEKAKDATKGGLKRDLNEQVVYELFKKHTFMLDELD